jgi:RNA polymerase sigma-70 factor (ECF subfamily)
VARPFNLGQGLAVAEAAEPRDLLEIARRGDTEAFGELCQVYENRLLRQAHVLCGNATLAEDLTQETLVEAWKSLHRFNGRCRFFTWLSAIMLHRHRKTLRQRRLLLWSALDRGDRGEFSTRASQQEAAEPWPDKAAQSREHAALVRRCVARLPRKHQQVIFLRFGADDSLEGIAAALGCSIGTVKSRLFHALEKLRQMKELRADLAGITSKVGLV